MIDGLTINLVHTQLQNPAYEQMKSRLCTKKEIMHKKICCEERKKVPLIITMPGLFFSIWPPSGANGDYH